MKNIILKSLAAVLILSALASSIYKSEGTSLNIGDKAPLTEVKMKDVSGTELSLKDKMQGKGLLVVFSCNTCPFVIGREGSEGWEGRYNDVAEQAKSADVGMILINSNEAKRGKGDSYEDMVQRAKDNRYQMSYVLDKNHKLADAFGARTTPHVYLFNNKFELVYKGAIDDNHDSYAEVKETWLKNALENLSEGKKINPETTRNIGCSIKRISQ